MAQAKWEQLKWTKLGRGTYNQAYLSDDKKLVLKIQREDLKLVDIPMDLPERSVRIWNEVNPDFPAFIAKTKNWTGWICPYISGVKPTDKEISDCIIDIFNKTGRIVEDAAGRDNFKKTPEGRVVCIDIGIALQMEQRDQVFLPGKLTRSKSAVSLYAWDKLMEGFSEFFPQARIFRPITVDTVKALLFIKTNRPDIFDVSFLKQSPLLIDQLAKGYDLQDIQNALIAKESNKQDILLAKRYNKEDIQKILLAKGYDIKKIKNALSEPETYTNKIRNILLAKGYDEKDIQKILLAKGHNKKDIQNTLLAKRYNKEDITIALKFLDKATAPAAVILPPVEVEEELEDFVVSPLPSDVLEVVAEKPATHHVNKELQQPKQEKMVIPPASTDIDKSLELLKDKHPINLDGIKDSCINELKRYISLRGTIDDKDHFNPSLITRLFRNQELTASKVGIARKLINTIEKNDSLQSMMTTIQTFVDAPDALKSSFTSGLGVSLEQCILMVEMAMRQPEQAPTESLSL